MFLRLANSLETACYAVAYDCDSAPDWLADWCAFWQSFWCWTGNALEGRLAERVIDAYGADPRDQPWLGRVALRLAAWPMPAAVWMED